MIAKSLVLALLSLTPLLSPVTNGNPVEKDTLAWAPARRLVWTDFMARPAGEPINAALTSSKIVFAYNYSSHDGFSWHIDCLFDKTRSWVRVKNEYILAHEQGHFDIAEIYARKLNKALQGRDFDKKAVQKEVPVIYNEVMQEESDVQNRYDEETDNSRNRTQQAIWLARIKKELASLREYANYR